MTTLAQRWPQALVTGIDSRTLFPFRRIFVVGRKI